MTSPTAAPEPRTLCSCGGPLGQPVLTEPGYSIRRCETCFLLSTDPVPSVEVYDDDYYVRNYVARRDYWTARHGASMERHLLPRRRSGRLLDIGAGLGFFLAVLDKRAWQAFGVDPSPSAHRLAAEHFGVEVRKTTAEDLPFDGGFDVITLWDVLPALPFPLSTLRAAHRHLKPDGIVLMRTPDIDGWPLEVARGLNRVSRAKLLFQPNVRTAHWGERSLRRTLEMANLRVISVEREIKWPRLQMLREGGGWKGRVVRMGLGAVGAVRDILVTAGRA